MIIATPIRQIAAPTTSERSGRKPSNATPHSSGAHDEDAAVAGEHRAELVAGLEGGDDAVRSQRHRAERDERNGLVVRDAQPAQVGAADLGDGGGDDSATERGSRAPVPDLSKHGIAARSPAGEAGQRGSGQAPRASGP